MSVKSICIFVSGGGSHLKCIHKATLDAELLADVALVITNNVSCAAAEYAKNQNIPVLVAQSEYDILTNLRHHNIEYIVLAGYIKKVPSSIVRKYHNKIVNIHPSLLPKYGGKGMYGLNVHRAVLENKEVQTGCTVHLVNEFYDEGDILSQKKIDIPDYIKTPEQLADFLKPIENNFYLEFLKTYLK